jgi:hypothetical protein
MHACTMYIQNHLDANRAARRCAVCSVATSLAARTFKRTLKNPGNLNLERSCGLWVRNAGGPVESSECATEHRDRMHPSAGPKHASHGGKQKDSGCVHCDRMAVAHGDQGGKIERLGNVQFVMREMRAPSEWKVRRGGCRGEHRTQTNNIKLPSG